MNGRAQMRGQDPTSQPENTLIDLRIYFSGLIAIAEDNKPGRPLSSQALLVEARDPARVPRAKGAPPHYAVLQFSAEDFEGDPPKFLERRVGGAGLPDRLLWFLDKDTVGLDPALPTYERDLHVTRAPINGRTLPGAGDLGSIAWVSPLEVRPFAVPRLRAGILDPIRSRSNAKRLAGAFLLRRGTLLPAAFVTELNHFVLFDYPGHGPRAITSVLQLAVQVQGGEVRFLSQKFDGSKGEMITLKPKAVSSRCPRVEVWVLNREWEAIDSLAPSRPILREQFSPEYFLLYDLLERQPCDGELLPRALRLQRRLEVPPHLHECINPEMRRIYFPTSVGEGAVSSPCSPNYIAR